MSTEILNPVTQPSLLIPTLYGVRPQRKHYRCPKCGSDNRSQLAAIQSGGFLFRCDWENNSWFISSKIVLNDILLDQIKRVSDFTRTTGKEFGSLILRTDKGIVLDMIQIGKEKEIELSLTRELREGEFCIGIYHVHPISNEQSVYDVATFLRDCAESIDCVSGHDGSLTVLIKTPETIPLEPQELEQWEKNHLESKLETIAKERKFRLFRGKPDSLHSVDDLMSQKTTTLEELMQDIKGVKSLS